MGKKIGRPLIKIDWSQVEKLGAIHATGEEIASFFDISYDTLERACKREQNVPFAEWIKQKGCKGNISLRRKQYTTAMEGNVTMLIWLGKNILKQKDKSDEEIAIDKENSLSQAMRELANNLPV